MISDKVFDQIRDIEIMKENLVRTIKAKEELTIR